MQDDPFSVDEFAAVTAKLSNTPAQLSAASEMVERQARLEAWIMKAEELIAVRKKELHELCTNTVVAALDTANQAAFTLASGPYAGVKCAVTDFVTGALPKEPAKRDTALKLLVDYAATDLIKVEVVVRFNRSEREDAHLLYENLKEQGMPVELTESVHAQTLAAYARERLRKGETIDAPGLGLFVGRKTKLTWPKGT
jgi:hypothetical protein